MAHRTSTTRLPAALREQLDQEKGQNTEKWAKHVVNRKRARKQERQEHKQRKAEFFSRTKAVELQPSRKRPANDQPETEPARKKSRPSVPPSVPGTKTTESTLTTEKNAPQVNRVTSNKKTSESVHPGSKHSMTFFTHKLATKISAQGTREEDAEDARISWLEAKLGTAKRGKKKPSLRFGDGLDDLVGDLDRIIPTAIQPSASPDSEYEEDSEASEFQGFSLTGLKEDGAEDRGQDLPEPESLDSKLDDAEEAIKLDVKPSAKNDAASVPTLMTAAQSGSRYIPPHLRQNTAEDSESLSKLLRQLKGLLNRLSEQNMASILTSIEELYRKHRRNDITSTLTHLIIDGISSHSSLLDSFVVLHASLVASLHKIIGVEFAAHFIQSLISSYDEHFRTLRTIDSPETAGNEPSGKECLNLVVLLSELYNFQVVSCVLVYDVIRGLLETLDEFDVEMLLKIARTSGPQLRQDDPSALKDIIQIVQQKMSEKEQLNISSRTKFMVETLTNLKNNKTKRTAEHDGRSESVERMKKFLSGLSKKHHVIAHEPLRVTLDDLHLSEKKGKWWLVGSAWGGDPLVDRVRDGETESPAKDSAKQAADALLKLARKQGMNTDIRRSIFVVLMSSDDYVDACERLSQLNLSEIQQREIVRVILHCLGNEKLYNPYYTLVVQQLCKTSHSYKVTLQFCLWDFLRDLGEKGVGGAEIIKNLRDDDPHIAFDAKISSTRLLNVARAYGWWIAKSCSSLTILKPVDFTLLQSRSRSFFRSLFAQIFVSSQVSSPVITANEDASKHLAGARSRESLEEVFIKATRIPTLAQGLIYFLTSAMRNDDGVREDAISRTLKWGREVAKDTLGTGMDVVTSLT